MSWSIACESSLCHTCKEKNCTCVCHGSDQVNIQMDDLTYHDPASAELASHDFIRINDPRPILDPIEWKDPTPEMLRTPEFNAVWDCIKTWDINVPEAYKGYCGATGNHVRAILDALKPILDKRS